MSKRELVKYLHGLKKEELEEQVLDLYGRFKEVKEYYNFVFNPKEEDLLEECKFKISKEYFPVNGRRPKMRRSVAQKYIRHFIRLGVDPAIVLEVMLYNIEVAQLFSAEKRVKQESFYKSMLKSYEEALNFAREHVLSNFNDRILSIRDHAFDQDWMNKEGFDRVYHQEEG